MTPGKSTKTNVMSAALIAPCGMNCRLCRAYGRDRNACPGCRGDDSVKPKTRVLCRIKTCEKIARGGARYCFRCGDFPCDRLNHLDKRYRTKYGESPILNFQTIKQAGMDAFIRQEALKWTCSHCGSLLCVHRGVCLACGAVNANFPGAEP